MDFVSEEPPKDEWTAISIQHLTEKELQERGREVIERIKKQISNDPELSRRLQNNFEAAKRLVESLYLIHATNKDAARRIASGGRVVPLSEGLSQTSSSFQYDHQIGLDTCVFFAYGFPDLQYGTRFVLVNPNVIRDPRCIVSLIDFSHQLEQPLSSKGQEYKYTKGSIKFTQTEGQLPADKKDAFEAEAKVYLDNLLLGQHYQELLTLLLAVQEEVPPSIEMIGALCDSLPPAFSCNKLEILDLTQHSPKDLARALLHAEIKLRRTANPEEIIAVYFVEGEETPIDPVVPIKTYPNLYSVGQAEKIRILSEVLYPQIDQAAPT